MLRADGTANAGEGDVETLGSAELATDWTSPLLNSRRASASTVCFDFGFYEHSIDALPDLAFVRPRRSFQPQIVQLSKDAVLARHPAIAKGLPIVLASSTDCGLLAQARTATSLIALSSAAVEKSDSLGTV